jgi:hypothetical protein
MTKVDYVGELRKMADEECLEGCDARDCHRSRVLLEVADELERLTLRPATQAMAWKVKAHLMATIESERALRINSEGVLRLVVGRAMAKAFLAECNPTPPAAKEAPC